MDRQLTSTEKNRTRRRRLLMAAAVLAAAGLAVAGIFRITRTSVDASSLRFVTADRGDVDAGISATGSVVPAFEEIIISPIHSRVVEVYHRAGDIVEAGTPLLRLDLDATRTAYDSELDKLAMLRLEARRQQADARTRLGDISKRIEVARMNLSRREVELRNERYLDSIGSGTADRVHEVELQRNSSRLELEQLEQQLANETEAMRAAAELKRLEIEIKEKELSQQQRTLGDAEIRAPRRATITSIADRLGATVTAGQQVAVVADLGHYRVDGKVAEREAPAVKAGTPVALVIARDTVEGLVSSVAPTAVNGFVDISVALVRDSLDILRPGVRADLRVSSGLRPGVVRVPNASFYTGPGVYSLYVQAPGSDRLELRRVTLGSAGHDYAEVVSGLAPGERVVISDTKQFEGKQSIPLQ